jgi:hypothetical protein
VVVGEAVRVVVVDVVGDTDVVVEAGSAVCLADAVFVWPGRSLVRTRAVTVPAGTTRTAIARAIHLARVRCTTSNPGKMGAGVPWAGAETAGPGAVSEVGSPGLFLDSTLRVPHSVQKIESLGNGEPHSTQNWFRSESVICG